MSENIMQYPSDSNGLISAVTHYPTLVEDTIGNISIYDCPGEDNDLIFIYVLRDVNTGNEQIVSASLSQLVSDYQKYIQTNKMKYVNMKADNLHAITYDSIIYLINKLEDAYQTVSTSPTTH